MTNMTNTTNIEKSTYPANVTALRTFYSSDYDVDPTGTRCSSAGFEAIARDMSEYGGGHLIISAGTYLYGGQYVNPTPKVGQQYYQNNGKNLYFHRNGEKFLYPIVIDAYGVNIKVVDGCRFGAFNDLTGEPDVWYHGDVHQASPLDFIRTERTVGVQLRGLSADGNIDNVITGGTWGDSGFQIPASPFFTGHYWRHDVGNFREVGNIVVEDFYSFNSLLDGLYIHTGDGTITVNRAEIIGSARNNLSCTGARGATFTNVKANGGGWHPVISSNPRSGFDLEPHEQDGFAYDLTFTNCEFVGNANTAFVSDFVGRAEGDITFNNTTFGGEIWIKKPRVRFNECKILGRICGVWSEDKTPEVGDVNREAPIFTNCIFATKGEKYGVTYKTGRGVVEAYNVGDGVMFDTDADLTFRGCVFDFDGISIPSYKLGVNTVLDNCDIVYSNLPLGRACTTMRGNFTGICSIHYGDYVDGSAGVYQTGGGVNQMYATVHSGSCSVTSDSPVEDIRFLGWSGTIKVGGELVCQPWHINDKTPVYQPYIENRLSVPYLETVKRETYMNPNSPRAGQLPHDVNDIMWFNDPQKGVDGNRYMAQRCKVAGKGKDAQWEMFAKIENTPTDVILDLPQLSSQPTLEDVNETRTTLNEILKVLRNNNLIAE